MEDRSRAAARFSDEIAKLNQTEQAAFARIANKLLNRTFVVKSVRSDNSDFFFISEHHEMFRSWFATIDYELKHDAADGFHWIETKSEHSRLKLSKFDTALILVLRLLYHVKSREVTSHDRIEVPLSEIVDRFRTGRFFGEDRKIAHFDQSLRMLRNRMIVDFSCVRINDSVMIRILPTILAVVPADGMEALIAKLDSLKADRTDTGDEDGNGGDGE